MLDLRTITATEMRDINRLAVMELIRRESPISRSAIARRLDVSLPTVMRIIDQFIAEGFVRPHGATEWSGGRRRALLEFNASGHVVVGADLGGTRMFGALADLGGKILEEAGMDRDISSGEGNFQRLVELLQTLLASPSLEGRKIWGIGVGAPGVTCREAGVVTWAYNMSWKDYPLKANLSEHFNLPIIVDNDVNLAALGEYSFGAGQGAQNMVMLSVGTGIGAGIVINGALYRGAHEASGEVCNILPGREFLGRCFQEFGALETVASTLGIVNRAKERLQKSGPAERAERAGLTASEFDSLSAEAVFAAARQGQDWAKEVLADTIDYLAVGIVNIVACFDPELVILGGELAEFADLFIGPISERIQGALPCQPLLIPSALGRRAVVMGAITNVLHNTADFYVVQKLS